MARTVDPERHRQRRLQIIDAAFTVFAERGVAGATTAAICRQARIGSGTLFHYFATKTDIVLAVLALGVEETRQFAERLSDVTDGIEALDRIVDYVLADASDPRAAGFVQAIAGVMTDPPIAAALAADDAAQRDLVSYWVGVAARQGRIRVDLSADRITSWLLLLFNGFLERVAADASFDARNEAELLRETVFGFLRP